jgi:hypothetical protein
MPEFKFPKSSKYNFAKNVQKRYVLAPHLDLYFANEVVGLEFKLEAKEKDDAWHPSGDCTPTVTELYYMALDRQAGRVEKRFSKAFPVGHFWHQLLQKAVLDMGFATPEAIERRGLRGWGPEQPFDVRRECDYLPFHWATGQGDVAPLEIPGQPPFIVDFKTMSSRDYRLAGMPGWVAEKYEAQINIYMDFFDINDALILCVEKESPHGFKEFRFQRNQTLIDAVYDKWYFVSECLDAEVEPTAKDDKDFSLTGLFEGPVEYYDE